MLPSAASAALLRRLHHLLVFTSSILEPDFHLQQKIQQARRSGQVKLVSRVVSSDRRRRSKRRSAEKNEGRNTRPEMEKKRKTAGRGEERRGEAASRRHEVDVLFNVDRDVGVYCCARPETSNFHCLCCRCPSVRQTSDNYRARYEFLRVRTERNDTRLFGSAYIHTYIFCERDKAHADTEKREERALSTLVQQPNGYIDDEGRIHCAARLSTRVFGHATEE